MLTSACIDERVREKERERERERERGMDMYRTKRKREEQGPQKCSRGLHARSRGLSGMFFRPKAFPVARCKMTPALSIYM